MSRRRGPPKADDVKMNAQRIYSHFAPNSVLQRLGLGKPTYFYHYGITKKGRIEFMGPESRQEADMYAGELDDGEVFEMDTRDLKKATQQMKAELIRRGEEHDKALQRVKHTRLKEVEDNG